MKKLFVMFIIVVITVIASILYGSHSMLSQERQTLFLEKAYMDHYPVQIPPLVMD